MTTTLAPRPTPAAPSASAGKVRALRARFRFGTWLVDPAANCIERGEQTLQMEPRTMDVLVALCRAHGQIVSVEQLLDQCWGSTLSGDSPVHKNIAHLRRLLGDDATAPRFIETIRKRGYRTVAQVDFDADKPAATSGWDNGSPFRGLMPFHEAHADVFYGREEATRNLALAARAQIEHGLALLVLLGPSGSGKTSLVRAGLFPMMSPERVASGAALLATTTFDLADQGGQTLLCALASSMLDLQVDDRWLFASDSATSLGARLEHACDGVVAQLLSTLGAHRPGLRFGIFVDRFEALFNGNRIQQPERATFLATIEQLGRSGACLIVLACRNDFYPNIARYPLLIEGKARGGHVDLVPPGFADIAQMIRRPAAAAQLNFAIDPVSQASLDDVLCASAAASPDVLPLLQYCLHELYRLRTADGRLTFEAFAELGGVEGAIGQRAEQLVRGLTDGERATLPHIMSLVTVLSMDEEQVTGTRAPWSALGSEQARHVVTVLIEARLFVSDLAGDLPVFGIAHEAILRCWTRMSDWIAAHRDALRARGRLARQTVRWNADGRHADLLIPRGKLLDEAKALRAAGPWSLEPAELALIRLSDRRARTFQRIRLTMLVSIIALAILSSALAVRAYHAQANAEARRAQVEGLVDFMLGDFAEKLRPLGRLNLLESVSGAALGYLRGSPNDELSPAGLTLRAKALQVIGEVSRARGAAPQAIEALVKANAILIRQHAANPRDTRVLNNLGNNAYWVGQLHKDHNNMPAAAAAWQQYLEFTNQLHQLEPDKAEWWIEQSYAHNNLGSLAGARGVPDQAAVQFQASIALKQRALAGMSAGAGESKMLVAELADSYSWLASAKQALGQLGAAERQRQQAIALVQGLRDQYPDESMWVSSHIRALQHRAGLSLALGNDDSALADLRRAKALFSGIARADQDNHLWQVELAEIELDLLKVAARRETAGVILPQLRRVQATLAAHLAINPKNGMWARSEAVARGRVAATLMATGNVSGAGREIDIAVARLRALYDANQASAPLRLALVEALLIRTAVHADGKDRQLARASCREAFDMIQPGTAATMDFEVLDPWARAALCLQQAGAPDVPVKRLQLIGYRDSRYRQLTSNNQGTP